MMRPAHLTAAALTLLASQAAADIYDEADITVTTYAVGGSDLGEVRDELGRLGPNGYWAYTTWNVNWDAACETTVTAEITVPELSEDADLTGAEEEEFERMSEALLEHELGHVEFGVGLADEVAAAGCQGDTNAIHERWLQAERDYDAETEHGLTQGADLEQP